MAGAVAQGPVGSVQLCRILSINKSLQVTPIIIILQSPRPRPRPALHADTEPALWTTTLQISISFQAVWIFNTWLW